MRRGGEAVLAGAKKVAGAAELEVDFGEAEAVGGFGEGVQPFGSVVGLRDGEDAGEAGVAAAEPELATGLVAAGLGQERRALRLRVQALGVDWPVAGQLALAFELPAGTYATVVLRELARLAQDPGVDGGR